MNDRYLLGIYVGVSCLFISLSVILYFLVCLGNNTNKESFPMYLFIIFFAFLAVVVLYIS